MLKSAFLDSGAPPLESAAGSAATLFVILSIVVTKTCENNAVNRYDEIYSIFFLQFPAWDESGELLQRWLHGFDGPKIHEWTS